MDGRTGYVLGSRAYPRYSSRCHMRLGEIGFLLLYMFSLFVVYDIPNFREQDVRLRSVIVPSLV
jgi:hypothetical protein